MVSPESRSNWAPLIEDGIPESALYFAPNGNGMDISRPTDDPGYLYEDLCFKAIAERFPDHFIIGPHIIDYISGQNSFFRHMKVPDILFLQGANPEEMDDTGRYIGPESVILSGFAEFKSGKNLRLQRKVDGFMIFLDRLRQNPGALPNILNKTFGDYVDIPHRIIVPENDQFQISLVRPTERRTEIRPPAGVVLEFITLPNAA